MKLFWLMTGRASLWLSNRLADVSEFSLDRYDAIKRGER